MWFGKPQMQMKVKYYGQNSLRTNLSRWVQAYGMQLARAHAILMIGNGTDKLERARRWRE